MWALIRVLLADHHPLVRQSIRQVLACTPDLVVTAEAANGQEVFEKIRKASFDLILLDISLQDCGGLEILRQLRAEGYRVPVLVLSLHPEEQYAICALKAGASGYLSKGSASEELVKTARAVADGKEYSQDSCRRNSTCGS